MRRWMTLIIMASLFAGLVGCNRKEQEVTKEAEQTDAQMQSPEMKDWYKDNANKQPADAATDAVVTGDQAPTTPAPAAPATGN